MRGYRVLQGRIADPKLSASSKYHGLTTDRLLALRDSRYQDLRGRSWQGDDGQSALRLVTDLAGLLDSAYASTAADSTGGEDVITRAKSGSMLPSSQPQVGICALIMARVSPAWHPYSRLVLSLPLRESRLALKHLPHSQLQRHITLPTYTPLVCRFLRRPGSYTLREATRKTKPGDPQRLTQYRNV